MNYLNIHGTKESDKIPTENSWESSEEMNQVPVIYKQVYHSWYGNQTKG